MADDTCRDKEDTGRREKFEEDEDVLKALSDGRKVQCQGAGKELLAVCTGKWGR